MVCLGGTVWAVSMLWFAVLVAFFWNNRPDADEVLIINNASTYFPMYSFFFICLANRVFGPIQLCANILLYKNRYSQYLQEELLKNGMMACGVRMRFARYSILYVSSRN